MHVMPAFTQRQRRERPKVSSPVMPAGDEWPVTDQVAQRVHAPGHMLKQEDADQPGPEQRQQGGMTAEAAQDPADASGQGQRRYAQGGKGSRHRPHRPIGQQVGGIALLRRWITGEQPANMGVQRAPHLAARPGAEPVRRMRVARPIGERVVPPVRSHPPQHVALEAHRSGDSQGDTQRGPGGEAPVGQAPVEAHSHPEPGYQIEENCEPNVSQANTRTPQQPHRGDQAGERADHYQASHSQLHGPHRPGLDKDVDSGKCACALVTFSGHSCGHGHHSALREKELQQGGSQDRHVV